MKTLLALSFVAALAAPPAQAADCQCGPRKGHAVEELSKYKSAFAGRVTAIEKKDDVLLVTFDVARTWKGKRGKTITVTTPASDCGVAFEKDQDYLVYTKDAADHTPATDSCCPTLPLAYATVATRQLDLHTGYGTRPLRMPARSDARAADRQ